MGNGGRTKINCIQVFMSYGHFALMLKKKKKNKKKVNINFHSRCVVFQMALVQKQGKKMLDIAIWM